MIKYFIRKICHKLHKFCYYLLGVLFYYKNHSNNSNKISCLIRTLFDNLRIFNYKYGYYEYLEIPITTKCTLKCENCANLIPYYKNPKDYDINELRKSINTFLDFISNIVVVRILGGEPFISQNLYEVLQLLLLSNKVQRIEIVTNGTIIPKDLKLLKILSSKKVLVSISDYAITNTNKLINVLKENNINYRIEKVKFWFDYGNIVKRNKSQKMLITQFKNCIPLCKSLVEGKLHLCPRSSHGMELGVIPKNENDYLDLQDNTLSRLERRKKFNNLLKKEFISACDYCDYGTSLCKKITVAKQLF